MHRINRSDREEILNRVSALDPQDPDVRQRQARRLLAGPPHPAGESLEAKKIPLWKSLRQRYEKSPVAASNIDFERRRTWGRPASDRAARNSPLE